MLFVRIPKINPYAKKTMDYSLWPKAISFIENIKLLKKV